MEKKEEKEKCNDKNCLFHGSISLRGRTFTGIVVSDKMSKTAIVEWTTKKKEKKYERYELLKKRKKAHNPVCINAVKGEKVEIMECRPLSKTKNFVITKVL